jgi:hypothetical protein
MISLAMVLLLIIGINYVFRSATDAVSAGQALNAINADAQSTQPLLFDDLRNATKNPPCFIIASQLVTQFLNADDAKTSSDPTIIPTDNAGGQVKIGNLPIPVGFSSILSPAVLNNRNHRADLLWFFAHAFYQRRSGPDGTYTGSETSNDAFIEIGHAALPANDLSQFYGPSYLPNTASGIYDGVTFTGVPRVGAYASDWVLGRRIILLKDPSTINPIVSPPTPANNPTNPYYSTVAKPVVYAPIGTTPAQFAVNMAPLSYGTPDNNGAAGVTLSQSSRYDLAGVTPDQYDRIIANAILNWQNSKTVSPPTMPLPAPFSNNYMGQSLWWNPLVYSDQLTQRNPTPPQSAQLLTSPFAIPYNATVPQYVGLPSPPKRANVNTDPGLWLNRPECNPLIQSPLTAAALAEMAPYFLQHCSQFVVEYSGDYLQQDVNGNMIGLGPDGQIDFYVDANGNKHTRWYGMPRSSTGVAHADGPGAGAIPVLIRGFDATGAGEILSPPGTPFATSKLNYFTDVIPLRDYYSLWFSTQNSISPITGYVSGSYSPPWEVDINFDPAHDYGSLTLVPPANPALNNVAFNDPGNPLANVMPNPPRYVAAWHDDSPAMIRILIKLDDPNNKIKDGPWYEYVFRLK